ncbi:glycosyltransferase family 2 protein [Wenzhouxiangella sediminis]|uniref:Glycosyltransferase n=1 Tax=Wenzhouxiangella sediminis TaxID=1792836 RepID=A0A3E1K6C6_9GAMM|nr:glycosyltransferase family 2 protein [Wenzhouxiangella sediminis]RFF29583.1 glycosyltransferase [Wenzhouxiangella sediminis]
MKISVITATYNSAATIDECLGSIAAQDWQDVEHIVIDGGSTDGTLEVLERTGSRIAQLVSEPDDGIYDALNKGIGLASGDVVGFLHADDVLASDDVLSRIARDFEGGNFGGVYGDLQYVRNDDSGAIVRHWEAGSFSSSRLRWGWMPPHPALYVRREWYERLGAFNTRFRIAADYLCMLKLFSHPEFQAAYLPDVLVRMRVGGASNRSLKNIIRKSREDLEALRATGVGAWGGYGALAWKNLSKIKQFSRARKFR